MTSKTAPNSAQTQEANIATHPDKLVFAVPKGRILEELIPIMERAGIKAEPDFADENSRKLRFATNIPSLDIIRVRSFDVASFVAFGAAQLGVVGLDVLEEFQYDEVYAPLDLGIGRCHLSLAGRGDKATNLTEQSHIKIATKYPAFTRRIFAQIGVEAECIKLNGALELAPSLGLSDHIVDLVSSGATLRANGLVEIERVLTVSSRLIINRTALKTRSRVMRDWINRFTDALALSEAAK